MITVHCDPSIDKLKASSADRKVVVYDHADHDNGIGCIGNRVRDSIARIDEPVSVVAFDFLTIALAITAADEFVSRDDAAHGFARDISLKVSLAKPEVWSAQASSVERLLTFLSGDNWNLEFTPDGLTPPSKEKRRRFKITTDMEYIERVCLFSGGLDSLIGAINSLSKDPQKTLLVSRASPGDQKYQNFLLHHLESPKHLGVNDSLTRPRNIEWDKEGSTRTRSILFLAMAACCASAVASRQKTSKVDLLIPENGFIALNPPMTRRRRGPLSTRTAHPYYLSSLQHVFDAVGIPAEIKNPHRFQTKGEMILACADQQLIKKLAAHTISCGKWKRRGQQCGKCVPCLIRRSSMFAASLSEPNSLYEYFDLTQIGRTNRRRVDLEAVLAAIKMISNDDIPQWVSASGLLPIDMVERQQYYDVAQRGLLELRQFIVNSGIRV